MRSATQAVRQLVINPGRSGPATLRRWRRLTARRLDVAVRRAARDASAGRLDVDTAALLTVALQDKQVRDLLVAEACRADRLAELGAVLVPLVRRLRPGALAPVAATLAMVCYLDGDGALAWVAVDRALADDPCESLALLVSRSLRGGLPPDGTREFVSSLPSVVGWDGAPVPVPRSLLERRTGTQTAPARRRGGARRAG